MSAGDRFVLLGLARPRMAWFGEVSRWATNGVIPAEFVKCVSAEELRARLGSGRPWSAVLLDGSLPAVDRDLVSAALDVGCAVVIVDDRAQAAWQELGASAVLPSIFDRRAMLDVLDGVASRIDRPVRMPPDVPAQHATRAGLVVAVCGPGGTGASTAAAALAQGLGALGRDVVLADLARHAEQGVLHDVREVVPGVQELVEAHRGGVLTRDAVRALTFSIVDRGYALLLGVRHARFWPALRPRAFAAAFAGLVSSFEAVVCDVTADLEGERDAGSADVEERNVAARTAVTAADVVVVVGRPGVKGVHSLVRVLRELASVDVPPDRLLPVVVGGPRQPRARADIAAAIGELTGPALEGAGPASPLFLKNRPVDAAWHDGRPLPSPLPATLAEAVLAVRARAGGRGGHSAEPTPVAPGSLGAAGSDPW